MYLKANTTNVSGSAVSSAAGGGVYGPYVSYPAGTQLEVTVNGKNLTYGKPWIYTNGGNRSWYNGDNLTITKNTATQVVYTFTVPEGINQNNSAYASKSPYDLWEFLYAANGSTSITVSSTVVKVVRSSTSNTGFGGTQLTGYARGLGQSVTAATDSGGGGGGYYGGLATNNNNGGGGGGSGYVSNTLTNASTSESNHIGNGVIIITKNHVHKPSLCGDPVVDYTCGSAIKNIHVCVDDYTSGKREYSGLANTRGFKLVPTNKGTVDSYGYITIPADGVSSIIGPYEAYNAGTYVATIKGTNLKGIPWAVVSDNGTYSHNCVVIKETSTEVRLFISVKKDVTDLEFKAGNKKATYTVKNYNVTPVTIREPIGWCKGCNKNTLLKPNGTKITCSVCSTDMYDLGEEIVLLGRTYVGSQDGTYNRLIVAGRNGRRLLYTPATGKVEEWLGDLTTGPGANGSYSWYAHVYYTSAISNPCEETVALKCSEPHHSGMHYDGSNPICWDACGIDDNHAYYKPNVEDEDGNEIPAGDFVNLDYEFQVYYPNIGDFQGTGRLGLSSLTSERGKGYTNNMNTTKWTREKRIRFEFSVIYDGVLYLPNEWIELPVTGDDYPYYNFYCVLANREGKSSYVDFEVEAINCTGKKITGYTYPQDTNVVVSDTVKNAAVNDNTEDTNRERSSNFKSKHGAYRTDFIDVVGRIGNLVLMDTDDYRLSNWFKVEKFPTEWLIEGIVKEVDPSMQRAYVGDLIDIRGVKVSDDTKGLNTYDACPWLDEIRPSVAPIVHDMNNVPQLVNQPLRIGYNILGDISTIGNYAQGALQVVPMYYALDTAKNTLTPLDVYMLRDGTYQAINYFDLVQNGTYDADAIYDYPVNLDWVAEMLRRNYTFTEKYRTDTLAEMREEPIEVNGVVTGMKQWDKPSGRYTRLGNAQRLLLSETARTFIGSTSTYGELKNIGNRIEEDKWWEQGQKWHFKFDIPSSAVFVKHGDEPTTENIDKVMTDNVRILLTADIQVIGDTYSLRYDQYGVNVFMVDGKKFIIPTGVPPVIAIISSDKAATLDVDITGTH
jgi:hypothetical protein